MHRPRLLILDEPTNGLDPLNQQEFDHMVSEVRDEGRTVFLSSHILTEVEQTCNRVGIIREGQLVRVGGVAELKDIKRHEVIITFANSAPAEAFKALDGVESVEALADGHTLRLIVSGGLDAIVKAAAQYPVVTLTSHEPSLEDIFLRYYEGDGQAAKEASHVVSVASISKRCASPHRHSGLGRGHGPAALWVLSAIQSLVATPWVGGVYLHRVVGYFL